MAEPPGEALGNPFTLSGERRAKSLGGSLHDLSIYLLSIDPSIYHLSLGFKRSVQGLKPLGCWGPRTRFSPVKGEARSSPLAKDADRTQPASRSVLAAGE